MQIFFRRTLFNLKKLGNLSNTVARPMVDNTQGGKANIDKDELKKRLTPLQYKVTQEAATERPYTGEYDKHFKPGKYNCIVCNTELFISESKFNSGCGWPAFSKAQEGNVEERRDSSLGMVRVEVVCKNCGAHLGHVFEDGPKPTGLRYCINSASINFEPKK